MITTEWMIAHDASALYVKLFRARWPKGMVVTAANLSDYCGIEPEWFYERLLTPAELTEHERMTRDATRAYAIALDAWRTQLATAAVEVMRARNTKREPQK